MKQLTSLCKLTILLLITFDSMYQLRYKDTDNLKKQMKEQMCNRKSHTKKVANNCKNNQIENKHK